MLASERVQAAIVLLADGDIHRLRQALDLAATAWRDQLVAAGLASEDWPARLDYELDGHTQMNHRTFDALGFSPSYSCQPDPELPGDGDWRCPVHGFRRDGSIAEPFRSRWGTPLVVRFELPDGTQWVGLFEAGGLGGIDGLFACPDPSGAIAICDGQACLIDVAAPARTTAIPLTPITLVRSAGEDLIVLAGFSNLAAIGPRGQAWISERLCLDNLKITGTDANKIQSIGDFLDGAENFAVDAQTGELREGRRFLDNWPGP